MSTLFQVNICVCLFLVNYNSGMIFYLFFVFAVPVRR